MIGGLMLFLIVAAVVYGFANLVTWGEAHRYLMRVRPDALRISQKAKLSWPSRQLVKEFNALPEDWRPAGVDIMSIVKALEIKHGRETLDQHFCEWVYGKYGWKVYGGKDHVHCRHTGNTSYYDPKCPGLEHVRLHRKFDALRESIAKQEARLQNIAIAGDMDALAALKQRIDEYKEILDNPEEITS